MNYETLDKFSSDRQTKISISWAPDGANKGQGGLLAKTQAQGEWTFPTHKYFQRMS